jgi:hypothetical protein
MKLFSFLLIVCISASVSAQDQSGNFKKKSIFVELYSNSSSSISVNYENIFSASHYLKFGYRAGVGGLVPWNSSFVLPAGVVCFTGNKNSHLNSARG